MERLTTDKPDGNFDTMLNFVYGKDGWAYIRHDGEHEDVLLTDWAKQQCALRGCDEMPAETPEEIDQLLCDCMMDSPICPIAMAYCYASQAVHLRSRLKMYEDTMPLDRAQELSQAEKDGRIVVLPFKLDQPIWVEGCIRGRAICIDAPDIVWIIENMERFGTEIFLTREEAEVALKKREEADNEAD